MSSNELPEHCRGRQGMGYTISERFYVMDAKEIAPLPCFEISEKTVLTPLSATESEECQGDDTMIDSVRTAQQRPRYLSWPM